VTGLAYRLIAEDGLWLPQVSADGPTGRTSGRAVRVCLAPGSLTAFGRVTWTGRRGGGFLRAYDTDRGALVCAGESVRMLVEQSGEAITIDYNPGDETSRGIASACASNLGLSIAALFQGDVPLHCASTEIDGQLVGIMAPSGTGKSTLLWNLLDSGARLMSDDVLIVCEHAGAMLGTACAGLMSKLSHEAIGERGLDLSAARRVVPDEDEWWVPVPRHLQAPSAMPLTALFVLQPYTRPEPPGMGSAVALTNGEAISVLNGNVQGLWAIQRQVDGRRLLAANMRLLDQIPLYALRYHRLPHVVPDLARTIRQLVAVPAARPESRGERRSVAPARGRPAPAMAGVADA